MAPHIKTLKGIVGMEGPIGIIYYVSISCILHGR